MLGGVLSWWTEQMRDLIAPLTQRASLRSKDALVLASDPASLGGWRVDRRRNGTTTHLATLSVDATEAAWRQAFASRRRGEPVVVTLEQPFLIRQTTLPVAAAASLDQLLRYEMDRLTPFAAKDILYSHRVLSRDNAKGTLEVAVAVVPRIWVQDVLERLATLAVRPEALEAAAQSSPFGIGAWQVASPSDLPIRRIALDHEDPSHRARVRLGWQVAVSTCAVLVAAVVAVPLVRQSLALADAEAQIAAQRPQMDQVDALRRQIASGSAGAGRIAAARERATIALRALGVLTDLLPDDTWLTSVALRHTQLIIEGHSTAATKLIAAMTADPELKNPSFSAPVVRAENGTDIFTIQAGFGS